jgi:two-component system, sensor histidine kinase PdtaS
MTLDMAIICGLIVNELLTNAFKHGFPSRSSGNVLIRFENKPVYRLTVADNGVGLPESVTPGGSSSFGMQLIDVFVKQLNGRLIIDRKQGTKFQLEFN